MPLKACAFRSKGMVKLASPVRRAYRLLIVPSVTSGNKTRASLRRVSDQRGTCLL